MWNSAKLLMVFNLAASFAGPMTVNAAEPRSMSCAVSIDYLLNGVVRAPYHKEFVVNPGEVFEDDFSTVTRFRLFTASTRLDDAGKTVVDVSYFNDVGVLEAVDFSTELTIHNENNGETDSWSHTYWSSTGIAGNHTTAYSITCKRFKD